MGRLKAICFVAGVSFIHTLGQLPETSRFLNPFLIGMVCWYAVSKIGRVYFELDSYLVFKVINYCVCLLCAFGLGMAWTTWLAKQRLSDQLDLRLENHVTKLDVRVVSMPQEDGQNLRFIGSLASTNVTGIPQRLQISWVRNEQDEHALELKPGQLWRMSLILRRPRGLLNPHGFDYEGMMFQKNIRALGKVRGTPVLVQEDAFFSPMVMVSRLRQYIRQQMRSALGQSRYAAVMIALAIGDQDSVQAQDWKIFNLSGITHLVSISGSHVTLMAAIGASLVVSIVKRFYWRGRSICEAFAAKRIGALSAMLFAWAYCLLAGWGVPAQRTFFMLSVVAIAMLLRTPVSGSRVLCLAAFVVCLFDPWSTMAVGFWLSFGAVAVLFYIAQSQFNECSAVGLRKYRNVLFSACWLQMIMTLALWPMLTYLFHQASLSSLLANALAIPVVTFIVTPIALVSSVLVLMPWTQEFCYWLLKVGHFVFECLMVPVQNLALMPWANFDFPAVPFWVLAFSLAGLAWGISPKGVPVKWLGWVLCIPGLLWTPTRPALGYWSMQVLDVGQASALLVQTREHTLLFDTGARLGTNDTAQRVLQPLMRAFNVSRLDYLIVSHADNDHAGGLPFLLKEVPVDHLITSFDVANLDRQTLVSQGNMKEDKCRDGLHWALDGVSFKFLHPPNPASLILKQRPASKLKNNAHSCVLLIEGREHHALLPGDIGSAQEKLLLEKLVGFSRDQGVDVVIVPHHGSDTSSSDEFIKRIGAKHAVAQVGHFNRFRHPDARVQSRWQSLGAQFWRTDQHGAIGFASTPGKLLVTIARQRDSRYWQGQ